MGIHLYAYAHPLPQLCLSPASKGIMRRSRCCWTREPILPLRQVRFCPKMDSTLLFLFLLPEAHDSTPCNVLSTVRSHWPTRRFACTNMCVCESMVCLSAHAHLWTSTPLALSLTGTGKSPLYVASENGHWQTVNLLINKGHADVNQTTHRQKTPLYPAAESGHVRVVNMLLGMPKRYLCV